MAKAFHALLKNSFYRAIIEIVKLLSNVVLVVIIARLLGPTEYGRLSFVLAVMAFLSVGLNLGLPLTYIREGARRQEFLQENISTGLGLQGMATCIFLIILLAAIKFVPSLRQDSLLLLIGLFYSVFGVIINFFYSFFQAVQRMELEAVGVTVQSVLTLVAVLVLLALRGTASSALWGYLLATAIGTLVSGVLINRYLFSWHWRFSWSDGKELLRKSWPLMASMAFGGIYNSLDTIMLRFYRSAAEVGIYSAQYRVIYVFYIFSGWYIYSIFPLLSSSFVQFNEQFRNLLHRSIQNMAAFAMLFGLAITLLAHPIMLVLYGSAYTPGTLTLQISIWSTMISMVGTVFYFSLIAAEKQSQIMWSMAVGTVVNAALNILLIPRYGMPAAAVSTVVAQTIQLAINWRSLNKIIATSFWPLVTKPIGLGLLALLLYWILGRIIYLPAAAALSLVAYIIALFKTQIFQVQEFRQILSAVLGKANSLKRS